MFLIDFQCVPHWMWWGSLIGQFYITWQEHHILARGINITTIGYPSGWLGQRMIGPRWLDVRVPLFAGRLLSLYPQLLESRLDDLLHELVLVLQFCHVLTLLAIQHAQEVVQLRQTEGFPLQNRKTMTHMKLWPSHWKQTQGYR